MTTPAVRIAEKPVTEVFSIPQISLFPALPVDVSNILLRMFDLQTVTVVSSTCRTWRKIVSAIPRAKSGMCGLAAFHGYQNVIVWARSNKAPWRKKIEQIDPKDKNPYDTCEMAILGKHPELFLWAKTQGAPVNKELCMGAAVIVGDLTSVNTIWEAKKAKNGTDFTEPHLFYLMAAEQGQLGALKWLHSKYTLNLTQKMVEIATVKGHKDVVEWLICEGVLLDLAQISQWAARSGQLEVLQWSYTAHKKSFKGRYVVLKALQSSNTKMLQWLSTLPECIFTSQCLEVAASQGNLAGVQFLRDKNIPWTLDVCLKAAEGNHAKTLDWALQNGAPFENNGLFAIACHGDRLETLAVALANKVVIPANWAGLVTSTKTLEWILQNKAPTSAETALDLARRNRFDLIRCLWQNNIPINSVLIMSDEQVDNRAATDFFRELAREARGE